MGVKGMLVAEYDYNLDLQVQREECYRKGMLEGMQNGILKGKKEERMILARRMKKANFDVSVIQEITKLSSEEIEKL